MNKFLCFVVPTLVTIIIINLLYDKKRIPIWKNIFYYIIIFIYTNLLTIPLISSRYSVDISNPFDKDIAIRYLFLAIVVSLVSTFIIKNIANKIVDIYKYLKRNNVIKINISFNKEKFIKCCKDNSDTLTKVGFVIVTIMFYFVIDVLTRRLAVNISGFGRLGLIPPNLMTLSLSILFIAIMYYSPKIFSKIFAIANYAIWIILFFVQYFLMHIKQEAFSIYDLGNASEGFEYTNFLFKHINLKLIICTIFIISLAVISFILLSRIKKKQGKTKLFSFIKVLLICFLIYIVAFLAFKNYKYGDWQEVTYGKYYYNRFVNPKRSLATLGLYEYTLRDIRLYLFKEKTGTVDEINEYIETHNRELSSNEYTGIFKDKNLIMIMLESIDEVVVNDEAMPTMTYMRNNGWDFTKRYNSLSGGGSTILTEYVSMTGIFYDVSNYSSINNNTYPYSLPNMMNKNKYVTASTHENNGVYYNRDRLHPRLGFNNSYFVYDMLEEHEYYEDKQLIENDEIYNKIVSKDNKFMSLIITIAGHGPYDSSNYHCHKNNKDSTEMECFNYLANRTDQMLSALLRRLEEDDLLDDTVIVLYTDHMAYAYNYTEEDLKMFNKVDDNYRIKNIPFIIYNSQIDHKVFDDILVNDVDIVPTILNLFGIEYNPNYYMGNDIFDKNRKNLVYFSDFSFYDGKIYSNNEGVDNTTEEYINNQKYVNDIIKFGQMILSNDYYKHINK